MTKLNVTSLVLLAAFAASAALAQDNSEMTICRTKYETQQVDVKGAKDPAKHAAAMKELEMAKDAMENGRATECLIHISNSNSALR